jgi:hypothetical protein
MQTEPGQSNDRRPPQYSLATLLAVVTYSAVVLAVMRWTRLIDFGLFLLILGALVLRTRGAALRGMMVGLLVGGVAALALNLEFETLTIRPWALSESAGMTLIGGGIGGSVSAIKSGHRYLGWALLAFFVSMAVMALVPPILLGCEAQFETASPSRFELIRLGAVRLNQTAPNATARSDQRCA